MTRSYGNRTLIASAPRQHGFSLIEVMVTLAIVSVAALGMAGLQTVTLRSSTNALLESQAATLAQDLTERIRANPAGDYTTAYNMAANENMVGCEGLEANCNANAMAQFDLLQWKCSLGAVAINNACTLRGIAGQLPNGDGLITVADNIYTITIRWFDAAGNSNRTLVISTAI